MKEIQIELGPGPYPLIWALDSKHIRREKVVFLDREYEWAYCINSGGNRFTTGISVFETALQGDARYLPFVSSSVSTIFAGNLFGADGFRMPVPGDRKFEKDIVELGDWQDIIGEWARVLSSGGKIIVFEDIEPPNLGSRNHLIQCFLEKGISLVDRREGVDEVRDIFSDTSFSKQIVLQHASSAFAFILEKE